MPFFCKKLFSLLAGYVLVATACHAETLVIGVEDNQYLPHYSYENNEYQGFGRAVLDAFFSSMKHDYRYRALPVARLFRSFVSREVDFKYPDNPLWSADLKAGLDIAYSAPVAATIDGVSVLPTNQNRRADDIRILATVRGFTAPNWLERIQSGQVILAENSSLSRAIQQTLMGRVDGTYANIDVVEYLLRRELGQPQALVFEPALPHTRTYYYLSSIKYPDIITRFTAWMENNPVVIEQLRKRYSLSLGER